jgi:hypothetical protein
LNPLRGAPDGAPGLNSLSGFNGVKIQLGKEDRDQKSEIGYQKSEGNGMIGKVKRKITSKISNIIGAAVRKEMVELLPIIPQLIEFQNSAKEERQSFYDHTKDPLGSINFYEGLKERLLLAGVPVEAVDIDIPDFERWLSDFPEIRRYYEKMADVFIEKCLEHYLAFRHLKISDNDVYIDIAGGGSA